MTTFTRTASEDGREAASLSWGNGYVKGIEQGNVLRTAGAEQQKEQM